MYIIFSVYNNFYYEQNHWYGSYAVIFEVTIDNFTACNSLSIFFIAIHIENNLYKLINQVNMLSIVSSVHSIWIHVNNINPFNRYMHTCH